MSRASGGPDTPQRNWDYPPDPLRAIPVKVSVEDGISISRCISSFCLFYD